MTDMLACAMDIEANEAMMKSRRSSMATVESSDAHGTGSTTSTMVYVTPEGEEIERRWCNFLYTTKCPFCVNHSVGTMEPCKFMHLDVFVRLPREERRAIGMPNLMTRHMKGLVKEMVKIVNAHAKRELNAWLVARAWCGDNAATHSLADLSPYADFVDDLRSLGWTIPHARNTSETTRLDGTPYAKDVAAILSVSVSCLHYDLDACLEIMFSTLALVFRLDTPTIKCPEPELEEGDIMEEFVRADSAVLFDAPSLVVDVLSETASSAADGPLSPSSSSSGPKSPPAKKKKAKTMVELLKQTELAHCAARPQQNHRQAMFAQKALAAQQQQQQQQSLGLPLYNTVTQQQLAYAQTYQQMQQLQTLAHQQYAANPYMYVC